MFPSGFLCNKIGGVNIVNYYKTKVISVVNEAFDYYTVKLEKPTNFSFSPGQYCFFEIGGEKRAFSIASIPSEKYILIATRTKEKVSSFKKQLIDLKQGDFISFTGPFGNFKIIEGDNPLVLFASGVGITPIRSFIKELEYTQRKVVVIYASSDYFLFNDEIESIVQKNPNILLYKTNTVEETQIKIIETISIFENAYYYNSGAPSVVKDIRDLLIANGVKKEMIFDDYFIGY